MELAELIGWTAAVLMLATFGCRETRHMRPLAVSTNLAFIGYGAVAWLPPVLVLHLLLLPINLWRWAECVGASELLKRHFNKRQLLRGIALACLSLLVAGDSSEPIVLGSESVLIQPPPSAIDRSVRSEWKRISQREYRPRAPNADGGSRASGLPPIAPRMRGWQAQGSAHRLR